jgi:hypothetical protein
VFDEFDQTRGVILGNKDPLCSSYKIHSSAALFLVPNGGSSLLRRRVGLEGSSYLWLEWQPCLALFIYLSAFSGASIEHDNALPRRDVTYVNLGTSWKLLTSIEENGANNQPVDRQCLISK